MNTTAMSTTTQIPSDTTPLTREEMAAYYTAFMNASEKRDQELKIMIKQQLDQSARLDEHLKEIISHNKQVHEHNKELGACLKKYFSSMDYTVKELARINYSVASFGTTIAKVLQIADKMESKLDDSPTPIQIKEETPTVKADMSIFTTNLPDAYRAQWRYDVFNKARQIAVKEGHKDSNGIYIINRAYIIIGKKYPSLANSLKEYRTVHPNSKVIHAYSDSDTLRNELDQYLDKMLNPVKRPQRPSALVNHTPDQLYQIAEVWLPNIRQKPYMLQSVYVRMRKNYGCDLQELSRNYAKRLKYSRCSVGYTIANNPTLLSHFEDTVALMAKEQKEGVA